MKILPLLAILLLFFTGCRTAEDAFKDGQSAEMSGNNKGAIRFYLETIRLNPEFIQAKQRLAVAGQKEIDNSFRSAQSLINSGRGQDGLTQLSAIENLHRQISFHAPSVKLPANFRQAQESGQAQARINLFRQAKDSEQKSEWDRALSILSDIEQFNPNSKERLQILNDRVRINDKAFKQQVSAADQLYNDGKYDQSLGALNVAAKYADNLEEEKTLNAKKLKFKNGIIISEATTLKKFINQKQFTQAETRLNNLDKLQGHFERSQLDAVRVLKSKLYNAWATDSFQARRYLESWEIASKTLKVDKQNQEAIELQQKSINSIVISERKELDLALKNKKYIEAETRLNNLDKIQSYFNKQQLNEIRLLKVHLYNTWASNTFKEGKYRESWHIASNTLRHSPNNQGALDLQRKAMQLGRVSYALLPIICNKNALPFVKNIDTDFNNGPARNMPPFTLLASDFDMRDAFRAFRVNPQNITREQALAVARRTQSSFVIFRELTAFRIGDQFISSRNLPILKIDNTPANMEVRKSAMILNARLLITIVDAKSGHRVFSKEQDISSRLEYEQGFLHDKPHKFKLTNKQKSLLEPPAPEDLRTLEQSSVKAATDFFLKSIFPEMEKLIP